MFLKIFFVIYIQMNFVYNCDDFVSDTTDTSSISEEYLNIFRTIPTLFEFVMDVIEEKPEILEKDDISVFTRDSSKQNDETSSQDRVVEAADADVSGAKEIANKNTSSVDNVDDSTSAEDNVYVEDSSSVEDAYDSDSIEYVDNAKDGDEDEDENEYENEIDDFWDWFVGSVARNRFSLTSTEIAEKTLEIEKQLEEYNNNNKS